MGRGHVLYNSWFRVKRRVCRARSESGKTAICGDLLVTLRSRFHGHRVAFDRWRERGLAPKRGHDLFFARRAREAAARGCTHADHALACAAGPAKVVARPVA